MTHRTVVTVPPKMHYFKKPVKRVSVSEDDYGALMRGEAYVDAACKIHRGEKPKPPKEELKLRKGLLPDRILDALKARPHLNTPQLAEIVGCVPTSVSDAISTLRRMGHEIESGRDNDGWFYALVKEATQ